MTDPRWFFEATFTDGAHMTFYADTKSLAWDHAAHVGQTVNKRVATIKRLKHVKNLSADEAAAAGTIVSAPELLARYR